MSSIQMDITEDIIRAITRGFNSCGDLVELMLCADQLMLEFPEWEWVLWSAQSAEPDHMKATGWKSAWDPGGADEPWFVWEIVYRRKPGV